MFTQIMNIGLVPCEESAAQVGRSDYDARSRLERKIFKRMAKVMTDLIDDGEWRRIHVKILNCACSSKREVAK